MQTVPRDCTSDTCPVPAGFFSYQAEPAGNAFMLAAFAVLIPVNLYTGIRYKTPLYVSLIILGLIAEVVGHAGKILMRDDGASEVYFSIYMMGTQWGPTFISAAIYLVLPHVMVIYGQQFSLMSRPVYCNVFFLVFDIFTLAFQSVGVGFAANGKGVAERSQGVSLLLTGLALQAGSLVSFLAIYRYFRTRLSHRRYVFDTKYQIVFLSSRFNVFLLSIQISALLLMFRAVVRIAAFSGGLATVLAQSQIVSFLLDDTPVLLASIILTALPAGRVFDFAWAETSPFTLPSSRRSPTGLPLRQPRSIRERHRRVISQPFPSATSAFLPPSPRPYRPAGAPPALPSLVTSPSQAPVYQRPPYDVSPAQAVPFLAPEKTPPMLSFSPIEQRKKPWQQIGSPDASELVKPDTLWG
ncbi:RTA1 like protein-domain-containing protein [Podospora appendiculata]|uniref:RTA1 like protein-domain-containing protein n=1 Tax=Podospora appendiculata TaxID=314037 RepID=A0AAE0X074_9PEZI|nr:RTA1 like protein-domain-containing protein [Podospora appendiculata]